MPTFVKIDPSLKENRLSNKISCNFLKFPATSDTYKKLSKRGRGFTLIELLIVLAIIAILTGLVLASFQGAGANQEVKNTALELKSYLRKYQNFAISGQKNPDPSNDDCKPNDKILDYYEVLFDTTTQKYQATLWCDGESESVALQEVSLPSGYVSAVGNGGLCSLHYIRFMPVNQGVELYCDGSVDDMWIQVGEAGNFYKVHINKDGEIYEEKL